MALDWVEIRLPNFQQMGKFLLWAAGRATFSFWLFGLHSLKMACKVSASVLEMTERASHQLLAVYAQLPYSGTLPASVTIEATALPVGEPENLVTDLLRSLEGKHILIVGDTGAGKSLIAQWLAYQIGGQVKVYDADASPDEWNGLEVIGRGGNFARIAEEMSADLEELQRRIEMRGNQGDRALAGLDSVLIAEEFPLLADEVDIASEWLLKHARRGRKPKRFIIALSQDDSVKALRIEGEGSVRKCFRMLRLGKFAVTHAKSLKDTALVEWLKSGKYRCMVDDYPCQLPDLSSFKMITPRLQPTSNFQPLVSPETPTESGFQPPETDISAEILRAVRASLAFGISESKIIKDILGYQGAEYQKGKKVLESIKSFN